MAQGFLDVELAVCEILDSLGDTVTATGAALDPPVIQVVRTGGGADRRGLQDAALLEVTSFCENRPASVELNRQVRARMAGARLVETAQGLVDSINEFVAPIQIPDPNQDIRKVTSTWTVTSRLQELPD